MCESDRRWLRGETPRAALPVCFLMAGLAAFPARAGVSVALRARARAERAFVTIGDVARIEGGETELVRRVAGVLLGAAPRSVDIRTISRGFMGARLRQEGIRADNVAFCGENRVAVSAPLSGADLFFHHGITGALRSHVAKELGCPEECIEVDLLGFRWIGRTVAVGDPGFAVCERAGGKELGSARYVLDCVDTAGGDRHAGRVVAWTDAVRYRAAVVSRRPVAKGATLERGGLVTVTAPVRDARVQLIRDPEEACSREAARAIGAGEPIYETALLAPRLVRRGGTVTVVIETPEYRITSRARAVRDGSKGEVIPVENLGSGREFLARVVAENMVVVP